MWGEAETARVGRDGVREGREERGGATYAIGGPGPCTRMRASGRSTSRTTKDLTYWQKTEEVPPF